MHKLCIGFSPELAIYMWRLQSVQVSVFEVATSMYEIVPKKSSSSWEHWPSADLSMCCCLRSPFGVQAMNCASEKTWTVYLPCVLVIKKMHENKIHQDTPGRIPSPYQWPFPLIPSVTSEHLTSFPASRQGILIRSLLITYLLTNYTSVDTKILPLWLQAPFGKRVNKS